MQLIEIKEVVEEQIRKKIVTNLYPTAVGLEDGWLSKGEHDLVILIHRRPSPPQGSMGP
jgi:hypothetical protein